jgi:hypothetical protein
MARKQTMTVEEQMLSELEAEAQQQAQRIAADEGPAPQSRKISQAEEDRLYGLRDQRVDNGQLLARLLSGGLSQEEAQQLQIVKERPDLLSVYTQASPTSEMAGALADLAEYPFRLGLTVDGYPDSTEQVARGKALHRRYLKNQGQAADVADVSPSLTPSAPPAGMQPMPTAPVAPMDAPPTLTPGTTPPVEGGA